MFNLLSQVVNNLWQRLHINRLRCLFPRIDVKSSGLNGIPAKPRGPRLLHGNRFRHADAKRGAGHDVVMS